MQLVLSLVRDHDKGYSKQDCVTILSYGLVVLMYNTVTKVVSEKVHLA